MRAPDLPTASRRAAPAPARAVVCSRTSVRLARCAARAAVAAVALVGAVAWAVACATQEQPLFSDGACVAGGCQQSAASGSSGGTSSSASSSGVCAVDAGCAVSWSKDIFTGMLDGPAGCTSMACHGTSKGGITMAAGQPQAAYTALMGYTLLATPGPVKKYIVPCSPDESGFPCNLEVSPEAGTNPFGTCGAGMPFGGVGALLTVDQVNQIGAWIQCGAPEN